MVGARLRNRLVVPCYPDKVNSLADIHAALNTMGSVTILGLETMQATCACSQRSCISNHAPRMSLKALVFLPDPRCDACSWWGMASVSYRARAPVCPSLATPLATFLAFLPQPCNQGILQGKMCKIKEATKLTRNADL